MSVMAGLGRFDGQGQPQLLLLEGELQRRLS